MKKTVIRALALVLLAACLLSLAACGGKFATVEDFVKSDTMQKQLDEMKAELGDQADSLEVTGEGNKLIYTFTVPLNGQDAEAMGAALEGALDSASGTFETVAGYLKDAVKVENPVVVVIYLADDGTELCSKEFAAK